MHTAESNFSIFKAATYLSQKSDSPPKKAEPVTDLADTYNSIQYVDVCARHTVLWLKI